MTEAIPIREYLARKDTKIDLSYSNLSQIDASGLHIFDGNFKRANLVGSNLSNCDLTNCDFEGADLTKADMSDSRLWNSNFKDAVLVEANFAGADFWNTNLSNVRIWRTNFDNAKSLSKKSFSGHINEEGLDSAEDSYRDLKRYFLSHGMYNDAGWASFKEKTIERLILKKNKDAHYIPSVVMALLCGYGEKPSRIVLSALTAILLYAFVYFLLGAVEYAGSGSYILTWADYIYYSAVTFTTVGYGDFLPKASALFRLLSASEAFLGVFLTGLFIFTLARRYSAR